MLSFSRLLSMTLASVVLASPATALSIPPEVTGAQATLVVSSAVAAPDGFERPVTVVNGFTPAPLIKANMGDLLQINVINNLTDPSMFRGTSIHWHGMYQHTTNWADGAAGVNQCPISPGESFLYQFSTAGQAGTSWYHSHYHPNDPAAGMYDIDDENTIITLSDWYHLQSPSITGVAANDATLINGQGRYHGGPQVDLAVLNVVQGKRCRFRIISMSCDPNYIFSIDGHELMIIEADGQNTRPYTVDSIQILAGQRYSVVLNANQPVDNYWIRALPNSGNYDLATGFAGGTNSAILRYFGAPMTVDPTSTAPANPVVFDETLLHPLDNSPVPGEPYPGGADVNINLALDFDMEAWRFYINGVTFQPPTIPALLQIWSGVQAVQSLLPEGSVCSLPPNASIEISIPGGVISSPHPFHLHGHAFSVVKSAGIDTPHNYVNPVRRDIVNTGDAPKRVSELNLMPYSHIDWHSDLGLAIILAEDRSGTSHEPNDGKPLGSAFDIFPVGPVAHFPGHATQHDDGAPPAVDNRRDASNAGSGPEGEEEWGGSGAHDDEEWLGIGESPMENINDVELEGDGVDGSRSNSACNPRTPSMDRNGTPGKEEVPQSVEAEEGKDSEVGSRKRKSDLSDQSSRRQRKRLSATEVSAPPRRSSRQQQGVDRQSDQTPAPSELIVGTGSWKCFAYTTEPPKHASAPYPTTRRPKRQ
ncbi:hypothetical protein EST38_g12093 [Candolleomyces aberdarensis]|uniref:laccase n=1 Tax=Candolleomyces aberdarensis TaxID=2316362 RepID=A0A4Q2D5I6_9AGAR|nr:hypothetical protein EST38_g12093 [Candolleomyces aberdarensis]